MYRLYLNTIHFLYGSWSPVDFGLSGREEFSDQSLEDAKGQQSTLKCRLRGVIAL